jgi:AraC-like DNA-binding protein
MKAGKELLQVAAGLKFEPHDIASELDSRGHYAVDLDTEFPLLIKLFHYSSRQHTRGATWHERLELFMPLDGSARFRMGEREIDLECGDVLVVDNLKLHHVVDFPGFNTRVIVISFLPEFIYSLGSPSHDYAFLLPFYTQLESHPYVLKADAEGATDAREALANLLREYFSRPALAHREAACKCHLLAALLALLRGFEGVGVLRREFEQRRQLAQRFNKLLERLQLPEGRRLSLGEAARTCGMSPAQFTRSFRKVAGMSYLAYVTHLRLSDAARYLRATQTSIAEIAETVGFADQSHLVRRFKQAFGVTPREFRNGADCPKD